jgi:hypothetical protein
LGSLHVLEVNVALLGFLDNLLDLQLGEVHLRRRVLVLRLWLYYLLASHPKRALLDDSLLRHSNWGLALNWRLLVVLLSLQILHELRVVDKAWLRDELFCRFLEILVVLKFAQFIQIVIRNGLLLLRMHLRYRVTHQNALVGVRLVNAELHLWLLRRLIEVVLEFSRILVVKRGFILDISFLIPTLSNSLALNLS